MKALIIVIFFLLLGAFFIVSNNNLALIDPSNAGIFLEKYFGWFEKSINNFKDITAFAVKQDWSP